MEYKIFSHLIKDRRMGYPNASKKTFAYYKIRRPNCANLIHYTDNFCTRIAVILYSPRSTQTKIMLIFSNV